MRSKFAADMPEDDRPTLKLLLDWIEATAKAKETRRCAKLVRDCSVSWKSQRWTFELIADDILRTGGLEVESTDGKMKPGDPIGSSF